MVTLFRLIDFVGYMIINLSILKNKFLAKGEYVKFKVYFVVYSRGTKRKLLYLQKIFKTNP